MSVILTNPDPIKSPIVNAPKQPLHTQKTFWAVVAAGIAAALPLIGQSIPTVLPFIQDPRWHNLLYSLGIFVAALAGFFGRSGAVDDANANVVPSARVPNAQ